MRTAIIVLEPFFACRVQYLSHEDFRGGFILPSHGKGFVPSKQEDEVVDSNLVLSYRQYEALQVSLFVEKVVFFRQYLSC